MNFRALLVAVVAALGVAPEAVAAGEAQLDVFPERPRVGERVTVQLRTYAFFPDQRPPTIFPASYPMMLNVLGAKGQQFELRLVRDAGDPYVWRHSYRFPAPGRWIVCGANWQGSLEGCAERNPTRRILRIRPRNAAVDVWHRLQRPLATPSAAVGAQCPASAARGPGPAYPFGGGETAALSYADPIPRTSELFGSPWFGNKVNWIVDRARHRGPVLVRGRRVDGPELVRFDGGRVPTRELRIEATDESRPSYTRVLKPGCYAYQVDGLNFSYTIVFSATPG